MGLSLALASGSPAWGASRARLAVPAGDLADTLAQIARATGVSVGFSGVLPSVRTRPLRGAFTAEEALRRLLLGTDLVLVRVEDDVFRIEVRRHERSAVAGASAVQELVVVGTKRRETLATVPFAMTVVPLENSPFGARPASTAQVVELAGDVQLTNLGPGRNRLFIRGIADSPFAGPTQSTVAIYLGDARISFDTPDPDLRLVDVDRVEVLKGPQGSLYGTGALGGIYRIVPNKPELDRWSARLATGATAQAHGAPGATMEGTFNAPVGGFAALRGVVYGETVGGWIDDPVRRLDDVNQVKVSGGRLAALAEVGGGWRAEAAIAAQTTETRDAQYAVGGVGQLSRSTNVAEPSDNDFGMASLTLGGRLGKLDVTSTTAAVRHDIDSTFDATPVGQPQVGGQVLTYRENETVRLFSHETRLSDASLYRPWIAGVALLIADTRFRGRLLATQDQASELYRIRSDLKEAAVFGEGTSRLTDDLHATVGLRLSVTAAKNEAAGSSDDRSTKLALVPMAALNWRPIPELQVYGRYASASRPGGLNPAGAPRTFESDELRSFELGARYRSPDDRISVTLDLFRIRWTDIQSDVLQPNGIVATSNVGAGHNLGVEAAASARIGSAWRLEAGAVRQEAEIKTTMGGLPQHRESGLPSVPDVSARLAIVRDLELGPFGGWVSLSTRYVGRSRLSFDPALDRRMGGYATLDLNAALERGDWSLGAGVSNVFDSAADTFSFGNPFSVRSTRQHVPLTPRTLHVRLERRF